MALGIWTPDGAVRAPPALRGRQCYNRLTVAAFRGPKELSCLVCSGPSVLPEMLIILAIVILIFGANRLPELGKGIGAGIKNFKSSMKDDDKDDK